jgi:serine/threonine-protein kinase
MADLDTENIRRAMTGPTRDPFGLVGQVLDEQFRIDSVVGEGGFSVVYRGHHLGLSEPIAIKCLKLPGALGSAAVESFVQRFRDEGRILYKLSQGNLHIVRSIASGLTMGPVTGALIPYTILEWLDGYSLAEELEARRRAGFRGRSLPEIVASLDSAIHAVAYAHTQGVVHRDLNPGNIFFAKTREGILAKVLDFGLAKVVSDHALALGPRAETLGHLQIFAPAYAAPEQMDRRLGPVSAQTDVYTIALVLLESMLDRSVISGDHLGEIMAKTLGLARPTPRSLGLNVSDELEVLFASALELDPKKRPTDAGVFWGTLKHTLAKEGLRPPSVVPAPASVMASTMSPLDAFKSLPAPNPPTFGSERMRSASPAAPSVGAQPPRSLGGTQIMDQPQRPSRAFPHLANTLPLGDAAASARRQVAEPSADPAAAVARQSSTVPPAPPTGSGQSERRTRAALLILALVIAVIGVFYVVRGLLGN